MQVAVGAVLVVAVALRFWAPSPLWLDEALSVNISRLPVPELLDALRQDGSPPLYYLLLHGWMAVFGSGDVAVRSLSGVIATIGLVAAWRAGRRLGPTVAWPALLLVATSPFVIRYASETRMYSLVTVLTLAGFLALANAWQRPTLPWLAAVAAVGASLLLTHYWALYLCAALAAGLAAVAIPSGPDQRRARRCLAALCAGAVPFLPWAPSFLFQARHTGTPWAPPIRPAMLPETLFHYAQGSTDAGAFLHLALFALLLLAILRAGPVRGESGDLVAVLRRPAVALALVVITTLTLAALTGALTGTAYTWRYTSIVVAPTLLLAALGVRAVAGRRARTAVIAAVVALSLLAAWPTVNRGRTQAVEVADVIRREGAPGDVVVYCPDQLGPAVHRLLPDHLRQLTFPEAASPVRVDWVDYDDRARAVSPAAFGQAVLAVAGADSDIFLVWSSRYGHLGPRCERLADTLAQARDGRRRLYLDDSFEERMALHRYPSGLRPGGA